ncbi:Ovule protein [Caenorhabditis elegans]|uniref:Ovule protein n=1 Tax=Caenorhabditis elegans TaxID=6239 RepID=Q7YX78_CAEEL|nr:Ovule protein [Caenorhabditis elegans]CAE17714.1 Ovule protein [Caenorhabditis elegans]|eukprot:NP_001021915.1 Uncharacterized protein CELE_C04H4.1 [Caenorhabditis elegans]
MAFGGLLDGFLQEKSHAHVAGGGRKASAFSQPMRKDTLSMYQNREVISNGRKTSTMSMVNHKMSTISAVSVDLYPKYSWHGSATR